MTFTPVKVSSYDLIVPICEALGLGDPNLIRKVTITPIQVEVEVFLLNDRGYKYVNFDTGEPAIKRLLIPVSGGRV